jgi:hypothetical protein
MTVTAFYIPSPAQTAPQIAARCAALGITAASSTIPPVYATPVAAAGGAPCIVAEYGTVAALHDDGTKTAGDVATLVAPLNTQQAADQTTAANAATINQRVQANLATIETFISNNPSGAILTAGQTLTVAKMLAGMCRLLLNQTTTLGGS